MTEPRLHCYRCDKPQATCICESVPRLDNRTGITILQHPRERRHPLGTARFASLGLNDVRVLVDVDGRFRGHKAPVEFPHKTAILYPSPQAKALPAPGSPEAPEHLIVIDGTWHQAKTLYRDMAWLQQYPHYVLNPDAPSRYRIRREPEFSYISTLEALLVALSHLEPSLQGVESLLRAFDAMIDRQIECESASTVHRERHQRRDSEHRRKPRALAEQFGNLVLLYAETVPRSSARLAVAAPPRGETPTAAKREPRALAYFCAHRLRDDATFERWVAAPGAQVPDAILEATCARGRSQPRQCVTPVEFEVDLAAFAKTEDSFAAWGPNSLKWLPAALRFPTGRAVLLKAAYGALNPGQGSLEQIVERHQLVTKLCPIPGRGGVRLSHARAVSELIHASA